MCQVGAELAWMWSTVRDDKHTHPLTLRLMFNFVAAVEFDPAANSALRSVVSVGEQGVGVVLCLLGLRFVVCAWVGALCC